MTNAPMGEAAFYDGKTTKPRRVGVSEYGRGLVLNDTETGEMHFWAWETLRLAQRREAGATIVVTSTEFPDARLVLASPDLQNIVSRNVGPLSSRRGFKGGRLLWGSLGVLFALVASAVLVLTVPPLTTAVGRSLPDTWIQGIGKSMVDQIADGAEWCAAPRGQAVLDRMIADLSAAAGELPFELSVRVLDYPVANAFAAPGGHVVIFEGLIIDAESAEEVAGVLAHEIAHVIHRHPADSLVRTLGLAALTEGLVGDGLGASAAFLLVATAYSRDAEAQADATAVALLEAAGYDPGALGDFFSRLAQEEEGLGLGFIPGYLSTHPPSAERTQMVEAATRDGRVSNRTLTPRAFLELQGICG